MTPDELPAYLKAIQDRAAKAAVPAVNAIASTYEDHLVNVTLVESGAHGMATAAGYPPAAPPGRPPMQMTGHLRASVRRTPGAGGEVAYAFVAPHTIYAATQQWGGVHQGEMWLWVRRTLTPRQVVAKNWVKHTVTILPHPYMNTAVDETMADGSLSRAAVTSFMAVVWA